MTFLQAIQQQIDKSRQSTREHGWQFKERTPDHHTIGDFIGAVLAVENLQEAQEFYRGYIEFLEVQRDRTEPAKHVADMNIGWCFGEGMSEAKKKMWCQCTTASHPMFGRTNPTLTEAFQAGMKVGRQ